MKPPVLVLAVALAAPAGSGCTLLQVAPLVPDMVGSMNRSHTFALSEVYQELGRRNYPAAERAIAKLEGETQTPLLASELAYLRALLAERQGRTADAIALYRAVIAEHPNTPDSTLAARKVQHLAAAAAR